MSNGDVNMTDEELKRKAKVYRESKKDLRYFSEPYKIKIENAYVAGAKENCVIWHDLRENPNDLPKESTEEMRVNETWVYVKFNDNTYGIVDRSRLKNYKQAIAWCEIPIFER